MVQPIPESAGKQFEIAIVNAETGRKIPAHEPIFVIRAKDALAAAAISDYLNRADKAGCDYLVLAAIMEIRDRFTKWAKEHPTKLPD